MNYGLKLVLAHRRPAFNGMEMAEPSLFVGPPPTRSSWWEKGLKGLLNNLASRQELNIMGRDILNYHQ
jgi:hypothetical protein